MTDEQMERLALALIQLREAKGKVRRLKPTQRHEFYELKAEEREAVLALDHTPHELSEIQTSLRQALPGTVVLIEDFYVGGRGHGNYGLRIGDHWLHLAPQPGSRYTIALPEGL